MLDYLSESSPILRPRRRIALPRPDQTIAIGRGIYQPGRDALRDLERWRSGRFGSMVHYTGANPTGGYWDTITLMGGGFTAHASGASSDTETSLLTGRNWTPPLPSTFWEAGKPRGFGLFASGILSNTATPALTFNVRISTTAGVGTVNGTQIATSAAITTASGVSNKAWFLDLKFYITTVGQGSNNATITAMGTVKSPAAFASPFEYTLTPGGGDSSTVTATFDASQTYYVNLDTTWSSSFSTSNTMTMELFHLWNVF